MQVAALQKVQMVAQVEQIPVEVAVVEHTHIPQEVQVVLVS